MSPTLVGGFLVLHGLITSFIGFGAVTNLAIVGLLGGRLAGAT